MHVLARVRERPGGIGTAVELGRGRPRSSDPARCARASPGRDVAELQKLLRKAGFKTDTDGVFGAATKRAVQRFQRAARLETSGVVGKKTVEALVKATTAGAHRSIGGFDSEEGAGRSRSLGDRIPLRRGMHGHDVKVLQDYLRRAGVRTSVDGAYGRGTSRAVRKFEALQERKPDGVMNAGDIDALRGAVEGDRGLAPARPTKAAELAPGDRAQVGDDGLAIAPANAPEAVKQIIAAGNAIATKPYRYGGGHGKWQDTGYDCSGSVSYALHGAGLLDQSMPSGGFMDWGDEGAGQWVTIYANERPHVHGGRRAAVRHLRAPEDRLPLAVRDALVRGLHGPASAGPVARGARGALGWGGDSGRAPPAPAAAQRGRGDLRGGLARDRLGARRRRPRAADGRRDHDGIRGAAPDQGSRRVRLRLGAHARGPSGLRRRPRGRGAGWERRASR